MATKDPIDRKIELADSRARDPERTDWERERWRREAMGLRLSKDMWMRPFAIDLDKLPREINLTKPVGLAKFFFPIAVFFL